MNVSDANVLLELRFPLLFFCLLLFEILILLLVLFDEGFEKRMIPVPVVFLHHIHLLLLFLILLVVFEIFNVSFLRLRFGHCWLIEMSRRLVRLLFLNWSIMLLGLFFGFSSFLLLLLLLTLFANLSCLLKNHLLQLFLFTDHFKPLLLNDLLLKHLLLLDLLQNFEVFLLEVLFRPIIA